MKTLLVAFTLVAFNASAAGIVSASKKYDAGALTSTGEVSEKALPAKNAALDDAIAELKSACGASEVDFVNATEVRAGRSKTGVNMKLTVSAICK